jgi:hypothetical protein
MLVCTGYTKCRNIHVCPDGVCVTPPIICQRNSECLAPKLICNQGVCSQCQSDQIFVDEKCTCRISGQIIGEDNICKCPINQISDGIKCVCVIKGQIIDANNSCNCPENQAVVGDECKCYIDGQIIDSNNNCNCPTNQRIDKFTCTCICDGDTPGNADLLLNDPRNCGKCGQSCSKDLICLNGACQRCDGDSCVCPVGQSICGKECTSFCLPSQIIDLTIWKLTLPINKSFCRPCK